MADTAENKPVTTTPADLVVAIDAVLARTFGDLDLGEEARRLGVAEDVLRGLRDRLVDLREVARRAGAE